MFYLQRLVWCCSHSPVRGSLLRSNLVHCCNTAHCLAQGSWRWSSRDPSNPSHSVPLPWVSELQYFSVALLGQCDTDLQGSWQRLMEHLPEPAFLLPLSPGLCQVQLEQSVFGTLGTVCILYMVDWKNKIKSYEIIPNKCKYNLHHYARQGWRLSKFKFRTSSFNNRWKFM